MTLRAKRIVPIMTTITCVGTALTSSFSVGRASDGRDQGFPSLRPDHTPSGHSADTFKRKGFRPRVWNRW